MYKIKKEIERYITSHYDIKCGASSEEFKELVSENKSIILNNALVLIEDIEQQIKESIKLSIEQIKANSNSSDYKYTHAVKMWLSENDNDIDRVAKALLQRGRNKHIIRSSIFRKLGRSRHCNLDDIDLQRLRKIGVEV